jgi:hypothetical protein
MTGHAACKEQDMVIRRLEAANDHQALAAVAEMAAGYPLPHNVLGTPLAPTYVGQLAKHPAGGWYGLFIDGQIRATAHLALYGQGDCRTHSLWKIRHLLASCVETTPLALWASLLDALVHEALSVRPGSVKAVMFLSEHEHHHARAAEHAGFVIEGHIRDFYRLEELCLIYGRTARSSSLWLRSTRILSG